MISISYPVVGENFVNRLDLLKKLHSAYFVDNVALVGPRRIGKSSIAEQFLQELEQKNTIKFRFDVQGNMGTPGKFALRLLRSFLEAYFTQLNNSVSINLDEVEINPMTLMGAAEEIRSSTFKSLSRFLGNYFPATPENERAVFEKVLRFIDDFSFELGVKTAIVLDEFQEIIDLSKFKDFGGKKILGFLQNIFSEQKHVWYLFTGSAVRIMIDILEHKDTPFYGRVRRFNVKPFSKNDTAKLASVCTKKPISAEALNLLYALSNGHPYYTNVIIRSASGIYGKTAVISKKNIEASFILELSEGSLNSHCNYLFESSLARLEKRGVFLKEIMRELSSGEATITELSYKIGRRAGNINSTLRNLCHLDLIDKDIKSKKYQISDPILEIWLRSIYGQNEPKLDIIRRNISENYSEYIESLSTEIGVYFESYMREMLQKFKGQKFENVYLPKFMKVQGINVFDELGEVSGKPENIEIDAACLGEQNWICEFKYRQKNIGKKDIVRLIKKKEFIEKKMSFQIDKIMFVAKSGFSEYALNSDVWCLTVRELNNLLSMLNMKKIPKTKI